MRAYVTPGTLILDNCALRLPRFWAYRVLDKHMDRVNVEVPPSAEMLLSLRPTCCALLWIRRQIVRLRTQRKMNPTHCSLLCVPSQRT